MQRVIEIRSRDDGTERGNRRLSRGIATTDSAESSHGLPVVVIGGRAYGPADLPTGSTVVVEDDPSEPFDPTRILSGSDETRRFRARLLAAGYRTA